MALIWKKGSPALPSWSKKPGRTRARFSLPKVSTGGDGPGLLFFLVALVVVAVAGARYLGFAPTLSPEAGIPVSGESTPVLTDGTPASPDARPGGTDGPSGSGLIPVATEARDGAAPGGAGPRVIIYHAHTSENYRPNPPHSRGGRPGDIVKVGEELADALRDEGLAVEHVTQVFDHPQWGEAFARAGDALARLLDGPQEVLAVIDVHRDATAADVSRAAVTATVQGQEAAKLLFVVGDADNPHIARNAAFAEALKNRVEARYRDLSRGVRIHTNNYNGHLHPRSVQLFVGDYEKTTLEQARTAVRLFAPLLAAELKEAAR